ncbi:hypothetical protein LCGC14_0963270 [marine sediment metagenome]|uniref:Uncharacterized protein n=1 Tax=marine sediment metagenome TaxID=412755 RepID=A0A0F9NIC5_9ZZZZ
MENDGFKSSIKKIENKLYSNIKRNRELIDCCKNYTFVREFDKLHFNQTMNELDIVHLVLNEKYNYTKMFERDIINPIRMNSNNIFGILGYTGCGKSELAQLIVKISIYANKKYLNRDVGLALCWKMSHVENALNKAQTGDIIWRDESPRTTKKGSRTEKWNVSNVLKAIRKEENTLIFVDPLDIKVDLCNIFFETAGMNKKTRTNRFMIKKKIKDL